MRTPSFSRSSRVVALVALALAGAGMTAAAQDDTAPSVARGGSIGSVVAVDSLVGEFRGHYRYGLDFRTFVPCAGTVANAELARQIQGKNIWVELTDNGRATFRVHFPWKGDQPRVMGPGEAPNFYVRWKGVLTGPGQFGEGGASPYQLRVDEVLEMRDGGDCPAPTAGK